MGKKDKNTDYHKVVRVGNNQDLFLLLFEIHINYFLYWEFSSPS